MKTDQGLASHVSRFALLLVLLLAFFLRFYRLDAQSFWNDEGNSARLVERTPALILVGAAADIHPPGYYLLLHGWRAFLGHSEFSLRALSAVAGVMLVVFTYLLGCRLFGGAVGLAAAFLAAISPLAVYYSQEARMYALLGALSAASTYMALRAFSEPRAAPADRPSLGALAAYALTGAAGLYTHYAFPFVLFAHNLIFVLWWLRAVRRWRWLAAWAGAQISILLFYLPWLPIALRSVTGWPSAGQEYALGMALLDVLRLLGVGDTLPLEEAAGALLGAGLLLLVGLWPRKADRARWLGVCSAALTLLLPLALIFALDLYKGAWLKFLVVALPPFHLLLAHGVMNLRMPWFKSLIPLVGLALGAAAACPSLHNLYFEPAYARDDYRQIAADLAASVCPGDAIILDAPNQWEVFTYYYPDRDVYPAPYRPGEAEVDAFLSPLTGRYQRLFVLYWGVDESDPRRLVETWLATHAYKARDTWYGGVRVAMYGVSSLPSEPAAVLDARLGDSIALDGYALGDADPCPGGILPVTLFWEARALVGEPYKVTVQLLDATGRLVAQHDAEPGDGFAPTSAWQPGQSIVDRHGILIPVELVPGRYTLAVALYHAATGERLEVMLGGERVGDLLMLDEIELGAHGCARSRLLGSWKENAYVWTDS